MHNERNSLLGFESTHLHSISPSPFSQHQWDVDELLAGSLAFQVSNCDIAFLEMSFVALRYVQSFPQPLDTTRTVPAISLKIAMPQSMLLL